MTPEQIEEHENNLKIKIGDSLTRAMAFKVPAEQWDKRVCDLIQEYAGENEELKGMKITIFPDKYKSTPWKIAVRVSIENDTGKNQRIDTRNTRRGEAARRVGRGAIMGMYRV